MPGLVTATGVLGFLSDEEPELKVFALQTLNDDIDTVWTEVAGALSQIEALYEDETFPERHLAALVLAKVYYHLQAYNESMTFALAAGPLFKLDNPAEFEETIISKCIDQYIAISSSSHIPPKHSANDSLPALETTFGATLPDGGSLVSPTTPFSQSALPSKSLLSRDSADNAILDPSLGAGKMGRSSSIATLPDKSSELALQRVIDRLFEACLKEGRYRQVVGIAVEAKNLSILRRVIKQASEDEKRSKAKSQDSAQGPAEELMDYALGICMDIVQERSLRTEILGLILELLNDIPNPDYFSIAKCVVYLDSDEDASKMLKQLIEKGDPNSVANAYQIAFDLYDNGTQEFLGKILGALPSGEPQPKPQPENDGDQPAESEPLLNDQGQAQEDELPEETAKVYKNIRGILDGSKAIKLNLEFLYRNNHTDLSILNKVRDSLEARNSIFHTAVTFCNAFMNAGTTHDKFFRDNLEWLGKAVNWSKFTATAALGVIHRGNLTQSRKLLEPYLPRPTGINSGSIYSQGGALYAYGLIHANHGAGALEYLRDQFTAAEQEVIQHGGALGLGIAGMATGSEPIFENLKDVLFADSALNGEAVGLAMGLIMLGTGNANALQVMYTYAHDTTHEKIVRGCAIGMALIMYGRQEGADVMIEGLLNDPDPTLRYGGVLTIAMAYCGTGSNKAIRKLLHTAVSDVNDDVRRIAVMSLGFILFRKPGSVPRMVELLSESYNPHVRYGSAMALGISCAGTGLDEAIDLLEPMMKDPTDFVRQGALISLAMIMVQQNEVMNPKVASIRKTLKKVVGDRHEDAMTKFGASLALGIIDAGGRNCSIGLQTQTGNLNMPGIVGMAIFIQYWYWFPFTHFLSLAFVPTSVIGLDHELEIPSFKFHCATRPSLFDYPPEQEVKAEEGPALVTAAVLSTTAQAKRRAQKKEKAARRESMDIDSTPTTAKAAAPTGDKMDIDDDKSKKLGDEPKDKREGEGEKEASATPDPKKKVEKEKVGYEMENMSRVLPGQLKYISFPAGRYKPVKKPTGGPLLLQDTQPGEPKVLVEEKLKKVETQRAPVAGQPTGSGAGGLGGLGAGRSGRSAMMSDGDDALAEALRAAMRDGAGGNAALNEMLRQSAQQRGLDLFGDGGGVAGAGQGGAAAAAGVLTAVDEDEDGAEEAQVPGEFDYFTDNEDEEEL